MKDREERDDREEREERQEREERGPRQPPVQQGEHIEIEIISTGKQGDGIGKFEGFVIIVPGVKPGQKVEVEITKVMQKLAFAEVTKKQEE